MRDFLKQCDPLWVTFFVLVMGLLILAGCGDSPATCDLYEVKSPTLGTFISQGEPDYSTSYVFFTDHVTHQKVSLSLPYRVKYIGADATCRK